MPWFVGMLAAFSAGVAFAYHRWRLTGVILAAAAVIAVDFIQGTVIWMRPHEPEVWSSRPWDWACHATGLTLPVLLLAAVSLLALHAKRNGVVTIAGRMMVTAAVSALLAVPLIFVMLWWGIDVLQCDTL